MNFRFSCVDCRGCSWEIQLKVNSGSDMIVVIVVGVGLAIAWRGLAGRPTVIGGGIITATASGAAALADRGPVRVGLVVLCLATLALTVRLRMRQPQLSVR